MSEFNKRLVRLREKNKMKREDLAKLLGVSYSTVAKYEQGVREPDIETIKKISEIFDVTESFLLGSTNKEKEFDPIAEHNHLLKKYGIEDSGFFDIEKWKQMGPEDLKQLEDYFEFIVSKAKEREKEDKDSE